MFKKITFLFVASLLMLSSCDTENIAPLAEEVNSDNTVQVFSPKQDILFQYSFENETTGELKGWVIDKNGVVRTYDFTNQSDVPELPNSVDVQEAVMNNLHDYSTATNIQIDLNTLEEQYRKISNIANGRIDATQGGTVGEGTTSIIAYHYVEVCDDYNPTHHQMIILETFGEVNQVNALPKAALLVDWLKEIQIEENL